jgi:hypothetical protein
MFSCLMTSRRHEAKEAIQMYSLCTCIAHITPARNPGWRYIPHHAGPAVTTVDQALMASGTWCQRVSATAFQSVVAGAVYLAPKRVTER